MSGANKIDRRSFLQWLAGSSMAAGTGLYSRDAAPGSGQPVARIGDTAIAIEVDGQMRCRVLSKLGGEVCPLSDFAASEYVRLEGGKLIKHFELRGQSAGTLSGLHGHGIRHNFTGQSLEGMKKNLRIDLYDRYPGFAVISVSYQNNSDKLIHLEAWVNAAHRLKLRSETTPNFWSYSGATHPDRHDWVQPVTAGFSQRNFMGMNASDYGGGTPVVDVWRADCGLAVGHIEVTPKLVALPIIASHQGVQLAVEYEQSIALQVGAQVTTFETFVAIHKGDYFTTLNTYRQLMSKRGLRAALIPEESYEPIWCAWGYERNFTIALMTGTLEKAKELGLEWAVLDDGWQTSEGDWQLDRKKFPQGEADMKHLVTTINASGMKARLWIAPLAVDPGTDLLHDHTDMLLLDKDGAVQNITWWNSFYLCPAYDKTIDYTKALVRKILGEWNFAGLKIDGQHLNGVAPCFNPAHNHARPEESVEKLQEFWKAIYDTAMEINPHAVIEICPCGTSYAFHNMPYMNQTPAADPLSSWQVRHKGKTIKALMGPSAAYAGDHVELSDQASDFASTIGVGGVVATKFTWPIDPKPKDSFLLTPEKEVVWKKWITLYKEKMLPKGVYLGALYDIGFDKPETHVIEKDGRLFYAFYAAHWSGVIELRGLHKGDYYVRDYFNARDLGQVSAGSNKITAVFNHFLLLEAIPIGARVV